MFISISNCCKVGAPPRGQYVGGSSDLYSILFGSSETTVVNDQALLLLRKMLSLKNNRYVAVNKRLEAKNNCSEAVHLRILSSHTSSIPSTFTICFLV